jgi:arginyl-tRNA synthetase
MIDSLKTVFEDKIYKDAYFADYDGLPPLSFLPPPAHIDGDISLNWAMQAAKVIRTNPADVAKKACKIIEDCPQAQSCSFTATGFINVKLTDEFLAAAASDRRLKNRDARPDGAPAQKILIEFVSANPTGPLHVASGRGASLGDSLVKIFRALGYNCAGEYYINDAGNQAELLGASLQARVKGELLPENGYHGEYLIELAKNLPKNLPREEYGRYAMETLIKSHREDMELFGVEFAEWFRESRLHEENAPAKTLEFLKSRQNVYEKDGAVWLGTTSDKDDKDRVLVRKDGRPTYFLADIAYHKNKYKRGYSRLIDIWGADHHGYVARMKAAVKALGESEESFTVVIHQLVHLINDGEKVKMSKRAGSFITLRELVGSVGRDACRFFFASRTPNAHLNFDVALAKKRTNENPVFYVQYVHARISSIFKTAAQAGIAPAARVDFKNLSAQERALLGKMLWFKRVLTNCANDLSPHHLTAYLMELSSLFHSFYDSCRVIDGANKELSASRLFICAMVKERIAKGLELIGVSAPEKM